MTTTHTQKFTNHGKLEHKETTEGKRRRGNTEMNE